MVERHPIITSVENGKGEPVRTALTVGVTYYILGAFLVEYPPGPSAGFPKYRIGFINDSNSSMQTGNLQSNVVAFSPNHVNATAECVGLYVTVKQGSKEELVVATPSAYKVEAHGSLGDSANCELTN